MEGEGSEHDSLQASCFFQTKALGPQPLSPGRRQPRVRLPQHSSTNPPLARGLQQAMVMRQPRPHWKRPVCRASSTPKQDLSLSPLWLYTELFKETA